MVTSVATLTALPAPQVLLTMAATPRSICTPPIRQMATVPTLATPQMELWFRCKLLMITISSSQKPKAKDKNVPPSHANEN